MFQGLLLVSLCLGLLQNSPAPKVYRVTASTPFDASIIFEYAHRLLPEDEPLDSDAVNELIAQLKATGLFLDVQVALTTSKDGQKVDAHITPQWDPRRDSFALNEFVFEGFKGISETELRDYLRRHGVTPNAPLLKHPLLRIKSLLRDAVREAYRNDTDKMNDIIEGLQDSLIVIEVEQIAAERFNLIIRVQQRDDSML